MTVYRLLTSGTIEEKIYHRCVFVRRCAFVRMMVDISLSSSSSPQANIQAVSDQQSAEGPKAATVLQIQ